MTYSLTGPVTNTHTGTTTNTTLNVTSAVPEDAVIIIAAGHDSSLVTADSFSDDAGNSYDSIGLNSSSGASVTAWTKVSTALTTSDDIDISWSGSCDAMARGYAFSGITASEIAQGTKVYTESSTYSFSLNNTSGDDAVMIVVFTFPFDFGVSDTPTGWSKFADITDGTDQQLLGFHKFVGTGVNTCSEFVGVTVAYMASGVILPLAVPTLSRRSSQVIALL